MIFNEIVCILFTFIGLMNPRRWIMGVFVNGVAELPAAHLWRSLADMCSPLASPTVGALARDVRSMRKPDQIRAKHRVVRAAASNTTTTVSTTTKTTVSTITTAGTGSTPTATPLATEPPACVHASLNDDWTPGLAGVDVRCSGAGLQAVPPLPLGAVYV